MEEEEQRQGIGRSTSREGNPSMIWNTYLAGDAQKTRVSTPSPPLSLMHHPFHDLSP